MFGAPNPTCGDSRSGTVMEALLWVKCPIKAKQARNILDYGKNGHHIPQITHVVQRAPGVARGGCAAARGRGNARGRGFEDAGKRLCSGTSGLRPCVYR
jgi:hypothetical protein